MAQSLLWSSVIASSPVASPAGGNSFCPSKLFSLFLSHSFILFLKQSNKSLFPSSCPKISSTHLTSLHSTFLSLLFFISLHNSSSRVTRFSFSITETTFSKPLTQVFIVCASSPPLSIICDCKSCFSSFNLATHSFKDFNASNKIEILFLASSFC